MNTVYPTIRNGIVQLWRTNWNSPLCTVCRDAQNAQVYGSELVVSFKNGTVTTYRIIGNGSNAYPVRTAH
jgi:hypothetical protein